MAVTVRYLLDTNICIYIAKKRPPEVYQRLSELNVGSVGMSMITFGELRYGAEKSQHRDIALQKLAQLLRHDWSAEKRCPPIMTWYSFMSQRSITFHSLFKWIFWG